MGIILKRGILLACELLRWRHLTRLTGTNGQVHHNAILKADIGCTLHVQGTCTQFVPLFILLRLSVEPMSARRSNLVWACYNGWAPDIAVSGIERCKLQVPKGGDLFIIGILCACEF